MRKSFFLSLLAVALTLLVAPAANAAPVPAAPGPPPYDRLAAAWQQWVYSIPAAENPLLDPTGEHCRVGQFGSTWFLVGTTGGDAVRSCTVPVGVSLFFPVANTGYGAYLSDPPATKTPTYMRNVVACAVNNDPLPPKQTATVDGRPLPIVFEWSIPFVVRLPDQNILGLTTADAPNLMLAPAIDVGYYVLLAPLPAGEHEISFSNDPGSTCLSALSVTYHLTVA